MQGSSRIDELRQKFHENPRRYFAPLANEYRKAGDPEQAIAICRAHLAQQPGHMSGHVVYGQALFDARRPDEARTVFEKALTLDPDNAIVVRHLGDIAREKGDTTEARHWYGKALDLDPGDTEVAAYVAELTEPLVGDETAGGESPEPAEAPQADAVETPVAAEAPEVLETVEPEATVDVVTPVDLPVETVESPEAPQAEETAESDFAPEAIEPLTIADVAQRSEQDLEDEPLDVIDDAAEEGVSVATPAEPQGDGDDPQSTESPDEADREIPLQIESEGIASEPIASEAEQVPVEPQLESELMDTGEGRGTDAAAEAEVTHSDVTEEPAPVTESEDVAWRKTPRPEDSPFVTRTMAELYARQGYRAAALDVYRQLAIRHPDDAEIRERIAELTGERDRAVAAGVTPQAPQPVDSAPKQAPQSSSPAEAEPQSTAEDISDEPAFAPSAEDLNLEIAAPVPDTSGLHFTETEISDAPLEHAMELDSESPFGELSWELEAVSGDVEPIVPAEADTAAAAPEPERAPQDAPVAETAPVAEPEPVPEPEPVAEAEPVAEPELAAELPVETAAVDDGPAIAPATLADARTALDEAGAAATSLNEADFPPASEAGDAESSGAQEVGEDEAAAAMIEPEPAALADFDPPEGDDRAVVAYAPEPPKGGDLPHFTPRGPTVREFFAALGVYRPPTAGGRPITASAAAPPAPAPQGSPEDLPLATDAFSSLFADAPPVNEEDTRAAFALSGALSSTAHNPNPSSLRTSPPQPAPAVPDQPSEETRESEEDIRRFREWLDGLADS